MHYVPVKITLPGGAVKTMDLEQMATSPEEAAQRVAQSPVMQAYQRRGATVEVGNTASAAPAEATTPTPAETKRETTLPQPAANARNLPQAAASGAETSAETALPETDLGREEPAAAIAAALANSPLLAQVGSVDLSMGTLREPGVAAMVAAAKSFKHLKSLNLDANFIGYDLQEQLRKAIGPAVKFGHQREPDRWDDEDHYYCSVGE